MHCTCALEKGAVQAIYFDAMRFKIGKEIRTLQRFEYIQSGCHRCRHLRLCDVTQSKLKMNN